MAYIESASVSAAPYKGQKASTAEESIMKNVNLYRGAAVPNITFVSLEGIDGLDVTLGASYQPENDFPKSRRLCAGSVLGSGMNMTLAAILAKKRTKKETYQSDYYGAGEGGEFPLYRTGRTEDYVEFLSVEHPFWNYKMYDGRWEVLKEDGSVWTYGGTADSLEINVSWGNFTGPCRDFGGEEFPVGWYLSKVVSCYGNEIRFEYENRKLPLGGCEYTSEIHLKTAVSVFGQTVKLNYLPKGEDEYELPHKADSGVYQFLCERHYLDSLDVYSAEGALLHSQKLIYELLPGAQGEVKRLLKSASQVAKDGEVLLPLTFNWETDGDFAGNLSEITYPRGGGLSFDYSQKEAVGYTPSAFFDCPEDWNKSVANGSDFSAVLFTKDDSAKLKILSFDMSWEVYEDEYLQNRPVQNASLFLGNGIAVVRYRSGADNNYALRILKRVPVKRYDWVGFDVQLTGAACPSIACGADFVAVQYPDRNGIKIYQFNYLDNIWHEFELPVDAMGRQIIGAGDGCIFGAYGHDSSQSVRLAIFYSDENHNWKTGGTMDVPAAVSWDYEASLPVWSVNGSIASACFISDNGDFVDATVIAVSWDTDFNISGKQILSVSQPKTVGNPVSYSVTTETMVGFANTAFRYTPSGFIEKTLFLVLEDCEYAYAYSGDLMLGVEKQQNGTQRFLAARFDAVLGVWTEEGVPFSDTLSGLSGLCQPLAASDYAVMGRSVFIRGTDERWTSLGFVPDEADLTTVRLDPGGNYLLYSCPQANLVRFVPLTPAGFGESTTIVGGKIGDERYYEAGTSCFCLGSVSGQAAGISFHNLFRQTYENAAPKVTCLKQITLDTGLDRQTVFMDYDMDSARLENGSFAAGTAVVSPVMEDGSFGQTINTFFNGAAPSRVSYPPTDSYCNAADFYSHFEGQLRRSVSYDGEHKKIMENSCDMKAFDSHGFCIQQTKSCKTDYVQRFSFDMQNSDEVWDEITSSIEYVYEQKYFRKSRILQSSFDKNGKEIIISQDFHYAFEDCREMEEANRLNEIAYSRSENVTEKETLSASKYEYGKNSAGYYYQTAEYSMGRAEGEWQKVNSVTAADAHGKTLCEWDARGIPKATLYDKHGLYPVAVTQYAEPDEVLYCGFEPYEVTDRLTIDDFSVADCITKEECFSGTGCLRLPKGKKLKFSVNIRDGGMHLHFLVKTAGKVHAAAMSGGSGVWETSYAPPVCWTAVSETITIKGTADTAAVTIYADDDAFLDVIYVTPVLAEGESYVYTGDLKLQTAVHLNHGAGTRTYFDRFDTPCVNAADSGGLVSVTNTVYGESKSPNEMYTIKPSSDSGWYDVRQGYSSNQLFKPAGSGWDFMECEHFAMLFYAGEKKPAITIGDMSLSCTDREWTLKNGTETQSVTAPKGSFYLLVKMGERCRFYGDGTSLFTFPWKGGSNTLKLSDASDVSCIGYVPSPNISVSYADYSGRVLQDQIATEDGIRIVHTLYNELGVQMARTTSVHIADAIWGYRSKFVTGYNTENGKTEGEINTLFPESEQFPCTSFKTTKSSSPLVEEVAQPGREYAFGGGFTVKHGWHSVGGFPAMIKDGYGSGDLTTDADGVVTFNISDSKGKAMSGRISPDGSMKEITAYDLDAHGKESKIYYPNYFSGDENADQFVSVITYDSLGNVASRKDPNAELILSVYDCFGNLRFMKQEESSGQYIYHLYDKLGRKTEMGYVEAPWDSPALYKKADEANVRPTGGVPVKQLYYDEALESEEPANQTGQLTRVVTVTGNKTVEEQYEYDRYKRQTKYVLLVDGRKEYCLTEYDMAGNVTGRGTGKPEEGFLHYSYGVNGELLEVQYEGNKIYGCGYSSQGSLAYESFGENIRRDYSYNTANYLTDIKGTYFSQQLTYYNANKKSDDTKKGGQISEVQTQMDGPLSKDSRLAASYDSFGRVASVMFGGEEPCDYRYDANGNHLRDGIAYQQGSDQLSCIDGNKVTYEGYGALKTVENRFELQYEPVTQMVMGVKSADSAMEYRIGNGICGFVEDGALTLSVQSEDGKLFFERPGHGKAVILVYGANGAFAQIVDGKVYYLIKDYRSAVCAVADDKGLLASYCYDLFGAVQEEWESEFLPSGLIPLRFAGARLENTGLYRFKLRFYDPHSGRFLSPDPEVQYPNPYIYGGCDWINYFDPDGAFNVGGFFASLLTGLVLIAVGVAITVMTAGIGGAAGVALGVLAAGVIGAGISSTIYSVTSAINDDFSWSGWGIQMGMGAAFGMISAGIGAAMPAGMGVVGSMIYDTVSGMAVGVADGVVTNGLLNLSNGKEFLDNVMTNAITGAVMGGVMGAVTGMSTAARNAKSMVRNGGPTVDKIGFSNHNGHTKVGAFTTAPAPATNITHLTKGVVPPGMANVSNTFFPAGAAKWVNVKPNVATIADATMTGSLGPHGQYNIVFNNCTGYAINISATAGIYQPLWARSPATMNWWVNLTRAFQN